MCVFSITLKCIIVSWFLYERTIYYVFFVWFICLLSLPAELLNFIKLDCIWHPGIHRAVRRGVILYQLLEGERQGAIAALLFVFLSTKGTALKLGLPAKLSCLCSHECDCIPSYRTVSKLRAVASSSTAVTPRLVVSLLASQRREEEIHKHRVHQKSWPAWKGPVSDGEANSNHY